MLLEQVTFTKNLSAAIAGAVMVWQRKHTQPATHCTVPLGMEDEARAATQLIVAGESASKGKVSVGVAV